MQCSVLLGYPISAYKLFVVIKIIYNYNYKRSTQLQFETTQTSIFYHSSFPKMVQNVLGNIVFALINLIFLIQSGAIPIHKIRVHTPQLQQQNQHQQYNGGINGHANGNFIHPTQINYNNENANVGYQDRFQQRPQNPHNGHQDSNRMDDSHKIYNNQQNPQFQNYLYQKQNLHSRQKIQDLNTASNNAQPEWSSQPQPQMQGQVQLEPICTGTGCRNRKEQVNSFQNQNTLNEIQQPKTYHYNTNVEKTGYKTDSFMAETNKNFLQPVPVVNNNGNSNNKAIILDNRKAIRALENNDVGQRNIYPHPLRPHPKYLIGVGTLAIGTAADAKNKGKGLSTELVKIEYDFVDKDESDTYETTMELVADEL